jgi:hypothetical protein
MNRLLDFLARSALPGSESYHDFLASFSFSYCLVSLTTAMESVPKTEIIQQSFEVSSF